MNIKGWMMGVSWGVLCFPSWGLVDESVDPELEARSKPKENFIRPENQEDDMIRLIRAIKDYSDSDNKVIIIEIILAHINKPDLDLMLQVLRENLDKIDRESAIEDIKGFLDTEGQTRELQILEKHWEHSYLPFSALSVQDRKFAKECNPDGLESEIYEYFLDKLSEYLLGEQSAADTTPEEDLGWEELFKHSVAQQLKSRYTPAKLRQMNIDLENLLSIELIIALREREFTPEEESQLDEIIRLLDRSPEQRLWNAIGCAFSTPKIALQKVKAIVEEEEIDLNLPEFPFLVSAAGIYQNGGLKIVQFLLDKGADIEMVDTHEWTALHKAAWHDNIEVVKLLIDRGTNVNSKNENGQTPLHLAWGHDCSEIIKLLIDNGADCDTPINIQTDADIPFAMAIQRRKETYDESEKMKIRHLINELRLHTP
jgi:hypothetical protein